MAPDDLRWRIVGLLGDLRPADQAERADRDAIVAFVRANADCFGRANVAGHITASAFITDPDGRILMTHHAKLNRWLQLGGHSDPGEYDPLQTALREATEESGLEDLAVVKPLPIDVDIHRIPARKSTAAHDHLDVRYHLRTRTPDAIVLTHESNDLRWCSASELAAFDLDPATRRAIAKVHALTHG